MYLRLKNEKRTVVGYFMLQLMPYRVPCNGRAVVYPLVFIDHPVLDSKLIYNLHIKFTVIFARLPHVFYMGNPWVLDSI